ncbi:MAG: FAD-dependent oxidoreductase [Proteobacteria bacterium]|nr:FAD-dependent oxidoreductase [Pseudomonadota bacterium]HQR04715.1 hydroxysqualene dehydroxylase HpnE [Rhodocyclaceae bacterium]
MAAPLTPSQVAVIGAGYAGMATAVELASAGIRVTVFEASRTLGGRARRVDMNGETLDNGQHILLGAYRATLELMAKVGVPSNLLLRHPLRLSYPGRLELAAPRLPAPLHVATALIGARGLDWSAKFSAIRFMRYLQGCRYRLEQDESLAALLDRLQQPPTLRRHLWEPLCVAALNTPMNNASAQIFANILRDSLGARRADSDLLLPAADLSSLLPEPAARYIETRGGRVLRGHRITSLRHTGATWQLDDLDTFSHVVVATAPQHVRRLLADHPALSQSLSNISAMDYEPITTAYFQYPETTTLPFPMVGCTGGSLQWLFDRGALGGPKGLLAAVISAQGPHQALTPEALAAQLEREISQLLPGLPPARWNRIITEKRATFACCPGLIRPDNGTPLAGLFLAGDYTAGDYPATLEGAVRSGQRAAALVLGAKH